MDKHLPDNLACPLDSEPLSLIDGQLRCPHKHSFDIARQGHINLLPVQFKRSKEPGDSREMIEARQRFLNSGTYQPIADTLSRLTGTLISDQDIHCILDAGCGEGYYLDHLRQSLDEMQAAKIDWIGVDISKPAILAAARRSKHITWLVGTNKQLPVLPDSVDIILCLFGFPVWEQFARALRSGGSVVMIDPGPDHLIELRRIIYDEVRQSPPPSIETATEHGLRLESEHPLRFETPELGKTQLMDLLAMTPHLYRASQKGRKAAEQIEGLSLTVDLCTRILKKP